MIQYFGVVNSDQITRNNFIFPIKILEKAYAEGWNKIYTSYKNHDHLKPLGQVKLCSMYLEPGLRRTTNTLEILETDSEVEMIKRNMIKYFYRNICKE